MRTGSREITRFKSYGDVEGLLQISITRFTVTGRLGMRAMYLSILLVGIESRCRDLSMPGTLASFKWVTTRSYTENTIISIDIERVPGRRINISCLQSPPRTCYGVLKTPLSQVQAETLRLAANYRLRSILVGIPFSTPGAPVERIVGPASAGAPAPGRRHYMPQDPD